MTKKIRLFQVRLIEIIDILQYSIHIPFETFVYRKFNIFEEIRSENICRCFISFVRKRIIYGLLKLLCNCDFTLRIFERITEGFVLCNMWLARVPPQKATAHDLYRILQRRKDPQLLRGQLPYSLFSPCILIGQ